MDETGELTGLGPNTWAVPVYKHLLQQECSESALVGGIICDNSVQVRRIAFHAGVPSHFTGMPMKIARYDNALVASLKASDELEAYLDSNDNYSQIEYKMKEKPMKGWAMPYVTGHKYRVHWQRGLDFEEMRMEVTYR